MIGLAVEPVLSLESVAGWVADSVDVIASPWFLLRGSCFENERAATCLGLRLGKVEDSEGV